MKKLLIIPLLFSFYFAYAGTGSGNDAMLFYLAIIAAMSVVVAVLYSISFIRKISKERREKKTTHTDDNVNGENIS